jgi:quinol monooxygenase YgiN
MIVIVGHLQTTPENASRLKDAAASLVAASRAEAGNIAYAFAEDIGTPGLLHFMERWTDDAALAAHNQTRHLAAFLMALPTLGIIGFRTARYDVETETILAGA